MFSFKMFAMKIKLAKNGPIVISVSGKVRINVGGKEEVKETKVIALCRCGHSNNKPFCDGSHAKAGFEAEEGEIEIE